MNTTPPPSTEQPSPSSNSTQEQEQRPPTPSFGVPTPSKKKKRKKKKKKYKKMTTVQAIMAFSFAGAIVSYKNDIPIMDGMICTGCVIVVSLLIYLFIPSS